jgi:hypothetical protein
MEIVVRKIALYAKVACTCPRVPPHVHLPARPPASGGGRAAEKKKLTNRDRMKGVHIDNYTNRVIQLLLDLVPAYVYPMALCKLSKSEDARTVFCPIRVHNAHRPVASTPAFPPFMLPQSRLTTSWLLIFCMNISKLL